MFCVKAVHGGILFLFSWLFYLAYPAAFTKYGGQGGRQWANRLATTLSARAHAPSEERVGRSWYLRTASFPLPGDREFCSLSAPGCSLDTIPTPPNFVKSNNDAGKALSFQLLTYCRNLYAGSVGWELQGSSLSDWLLGRKSQRQGVCLFQISYHQSLDHLAVSNGYEWQTPGNTLFKYLKHTEETLHVSHNP